MTEKQLCDMAVAMLERSYVPYSHFRGYFFDFHIFLLSLCTT